MEVAGYDFSNSHMPNKTDKFTICHLNCTYNENNQTWSVQLPNFFTENKADYRQIIINTFIYYRPDGTCDVGTSFHSSDLFDCNYTQPEMDFFIGLSGTTISGTYTIQSRNRTLTFWFKDYMNMDHRYGAEEEYYDASTGEYKTGPVRFFLQCELVY